MKDISIQSDGTSKGTKVFFRGFDVTSELKITKIEWSVDIDTGTAEAKLYCQLADLSSLLEGSDVIIQQVDHDDES